MRLDLRRALQPLAQAQTRSAGTFQTAIDPDQLWAAIQADPRWPDWQEGRMTPPEWHHHITNRLAISLPFEEFCAVWNRALDPETILDNRLFADLGARCRLALLSNTDPLHAAYMDAHFTFGRYFAARIYSCRIGASKPSPAIYQATLAALDLPAHETLYIDDVAEFVEAARALGLAAIQFRNPADLTAQLVGHGLLGARRTCREARKDNTDRVNIAGYSTTPGPCVS